VSDFGFFFSADDGYNFKVSRNILGKILPEIMFRTIHDLIFLSFINCFFGFPERQSPSSFNLDEYDSSLLSGDYIDLTVFGAIVPFYDMIALFLQIIHGYIFSIFAKKDLIFAQFNSL